MNLNFIFNTQTSYEMFKRTLLTNDSTITCYYTDNRGLKTIVFSKPKVIESMYSVLDEIYPFTITYKLSEATINRLNNKNFFFVIETSNVKASFLTNQMYKLNTEVDSENSDFIIEYSYHLIKQNSTFFTLHPKINPKLGEISSSSSKCIIS